MPMDMANEKGYDTADFVADMRSQDVTPHVAQNTSRRRSAIDERTTRHPGYRLSQVIRKTVEHPFGWLKAAAGLRQIKVRGRDRVDWVFTFAVAVFNLIRMQNLCSEAT
jgi:Transposase DDE domain